MNQLLGSLPHIFGHPSQKTNYPALHKEGTFHDVDNQKTLAEKTKSKFVIGKHRQDILKKEGFSAFEVAFS